MPTSDHLLKDNEYISQRIGINKIKYILLLAGIVGLVRNAFFSEYYTATELTKVSLVVQGAPRLGNKGKGSNTGYRFDTFNQSAIFIISDGALDVIEHKAPAYIISKLHAGDTLNALIKASDADFIKTNNRQIRIIGCEFHGQSLFTPAQVEEMDNRNQWLNVSIAAALLTIGLIIQAVQIVRWINSPENLHISEVPQHVSQRID